MCVKCPSLFNFSRRQPFCCVTPLNCLRQASARIAVCLDRGLAFITNMSQFFFPGGGHFVFRNTLRRDKNIPANKATRAYFIPYGNKLRGRLMTTLPTVFNRDLALIQHPIRLHSSKDLTEITELAQDRWRCWRELTSQTEKAAEESQTKNWNAKRQ